MTTHAPEALQLSDVQLFCVRDAERLLRLSRSVIYEQVRAGRLQSVKQGRARRFTADGIREYIALLTKEAEEAA
ncbi:helix-turn-helix domain-containing protein [Nonomuraea sp. NPDC049152]|uniref:helix-turn-helix domain-containing protein n=1 Tax=Nonomuraea sp. NPDC049152 TaxID=3154350 RepID=UPI0033E779D1